MKIGMILDTRFPPDIRVEKEIETLKRDNDIFILCPSYSDQIDEENIINSKIFRKIKGLKRWIGQLQLMKNCYSKIWEKEVDYFVKVNKIQVIHVHDLPLLGIGVKIAKKYKIRVIADLHENYPEMLRLSQMKSIFKETSLGSLAVRLVVNITKWQKFELSILKEVDQIVVVVDEAKHRLVSMGFNPSNISVVGNYSSININSYELNKNSDNCINLIYAGYFSETRDLYTLVDAVKTLGIENYPKLRVTLVGGSGKSFKSIINYIKLNGLEERINAFEWMSLRDAENLMLKADIGLVPHVKSPHTDATIPHKLFQYMQRQLPVIVSNCTPLERIVKEASCGAVYESGNSISLAECISMFYKDPNLIKKMGASGRALVEEKYNWHEAGTILSNVYYKISKKGFY